MLPEVVDLKGKRVGNYVIVRRLGAGGMATVYLAEHPEIGRQVAIKILQTTLLGQGHAAERFLAEARIVTRIEHPNIIDVFDFGRLEDGALYIVMEVLRGRPLQSVLDERERLSPREVIPYLEQICAALEAAHSRGIIHRDLKPENIFVLDQTPLRLKVLDFGIAKLLEGTPTGPRLTTTGIVMGTPLYIAPEQAAAKLDLVGPATDLYSLGVILYSMLSGRPPFLDDAPGLVMAKHILEAPPPLAQTGPFVPGRVAAVVERCLCKEPALRPASAAALLAEFVAAVEEAEQQAREAPAPGRPARADRTPPPLRVQPLAIAATLLATGPSPRASTEATGTRTMTAEVVAARGSHPLARRRLVAIVGAAVVVLLGAGVAVVLALRQPHPGREGRTEPSPQRGQARSTSPLPRVAPLPPADEPDAAVPRAASRGVGRRGAATPPRPSRPIVEEHAEEGQPSAQEKKKAETRTEGETKKGKRPPAKRIGEGTMGLEL
jgi:tRNA A-37 threonylcarbamoyl transferase component Bud32